MKLLKLSHTLVLEIMNSFELSHWQGCQAYPNSLQLISLYHKIKPKKLIKFFHFRSILSHFLILKHALF